jgi:hypothetical protein
LINGSGFVKSSSDTHFPQQLLICSGKQQPSANSTWRTNQLIRVACRFAASGANGKSPEGCVAWFVVLSGRRRVVDICHVFPLEFYRQLRFDLPLQRLLRRISAESQSQIIISVGGIETISIHQALGAIVMCNLRRRARVDAAVQKKCTVFACEDQLTSSVA